MCGAAMSSGAMVVLRILWGFVGPNYARFNDFVCGPIAAINILSTWPPGMRAAISVTTRREERW